MKIKVEVEILDHPKFCNFSYECRFLYISTQNQFARCDLFEIHPNYDFNDKLFIKCEECKKHWKLTKDRQYIVNDMGKSLTQDQTNGVIDNS